MCILYHIVQYYAKIEGGCACGTGDWITATTASKCSVTLFATRATGCQITEFQYEQQAIGFTSSTCIPVEYWPMPMTYMIGTNSVVIYNSKACRAQCLVLRPADIQDLARCGTWWLWKGSQGDILSSLNSVHIAQLQSNVGNHFLDLSTCLKYTWHTNPD